ncbi:MAG: hypothetical protein BGO01_16775 [Armatimonadetes bacterium 55-13]|jgi:transposase|nr:MAG: hypothetical protein BGO01_16775 [Armatimonadetes bacterium 55-13]
MERREAAEFLGVSLSTLDRLASQGRLTRGRGKGKTKPVTVFAREELERLKRELETEQPPRTSPTSTSLKPTDSVGFRLDPYYVGRLRAEGAAVGLSAGEYARKLVVQALEEDRDARFHRELSALRENLAEMFYIVLVTKLGASEKEATEIVSSFAEAKGT